MSTTDNDPIERSAREREPYVTPAIAELGTLVELTQTVHPNYGELGPHPHKTL